MLPPPNIPIPPSSHFIPLILPDVLLNPALLNRFTSVFLKGGIDTLILTHPHTRIYIPNSLSLFFYLGYKLI
jgi:hypothetical protein